MHRLKCWSLTKLGTKKFKQIYQSIRNGLLASFYSSIDCDDAGSVAIETARNFGRRPQKSPVWRIFAKCVAILEIEKGEPTSFLSLCLFLWLDSRISRFDWFSSQVTRKRDAHQPFFLSKRRRMSLQEKKKPDSLHPILVGHRPKTFVGGGGKNNLNLRPPSLILISLRHLLS